jgi:DNA-binding NarL/FixJ family response regulator
MILSAHEDYLHLTKALSAGADGYLSKEVGSQELIDAIYAVTRSERVFSRSILTLLNNLYPAKAEMLPDPVILTRREQEILDLIAKGFTSQEIAAHIHLSSRTVETHRYNLINKLGVKNTAGLVRFAMMRNGSEEMNNVEKN